MSDETPPPSGDPTPTPPPAGPPGHIPPPPPRTGNWWNRRGLGQKIGIVVGSVFLALMIVGALIPAEDEGAGETKASKKAVEAPEPTAEEIAEDEAAEEQAEEDRAADEKAAAKKAAADEAAEKAAAKKAAAEKAAAKKAAAEKAAAKLAASTITISAAELVKAFEDNELAADQRFKGKRLKITGVVDKIDTELFNDDEYILIIDSGDEWDFFGVSCYGMSQEVLAKLSVDTTVTVFGDFDDGGDLGVTVKDCTLA